LSAGLAFLAFCPMPCWMRGPSEAGRTCAGGSRLTITEASVAALSEDGGFDDVDESRPRRRRSSPRSTSSRRGRCEPPGQYQVSTFPGCEVYYTPPPVPGPSPATPGSTVASPTPGHAPTPTPTPLPTPTASKRNATDRAQQASSASPRGGQLGRPSVFVVSSPPRALRRRIYGYAVPSARG
jgi:hypothetical protein